MEEKKENKTLLDQALEQVSEEAKIHVELMDTTIPISDMFEFARWVYLLSGDLMLKESDPGFKDGWYEWIPFTPKFPNYEGRWVLMGSDQDLWNKYKEYKQKVKKEANE